MTLKNRWKNKLNDKTKKIVLSVIFCLFIILPTCIVFAVNADYSDIYKQPKLHGGEVSLKGFELSNQSIDLNLQGEWEFYYNKFIVSDDITCEPDCLINLPYKWTNVKLDGKNLPNNGYASYAITVKDVPKGTTLNVVLNNFRGAFRAFIDGQLIAVCGTVSKNVSETKLSGRVIEKHDFIADDNKDIRLVVEVSANKHGGLYVPVWLSTSYENRGTALAVLNIGIIIPVVLFILSLLTIFLEFNVKKFKESLFPVCFAVLLFIHGLFTREASLLLTQEFALSYRPLPIICCISGFAVLFWHWWQNYRKYNKSKKIPLIIFGTNCLFLLGTFLSEGYVFQYLFPVLSIVSLTACYLPFIGKSAKDDFIFLLLAASFSLEGADLCGLLGFGTEGIVSCMLIPVILTLLVYEIIRLTKLAAVLDDMNALQKNLQDMKFNNLNSQALPHYIFNTLSCIRAVYRKDTEEGERALDGFCKRLRYEIDNKNTAAVPFRDELEECEIFADLERLKGEKTELLFNIEEENFSLPQYSVFNLVENAYKHAFDGSEECPTIVISSTDEGEFYKITVSDNGCGYEPMTEFGHTGLSGTEERLKLIGGKLEIISEKGSGTVITVILPKKETE